MASAIPQQLDRTEAIDMLRSQLLKRLPEEISVCKYAAQAGVFCHGFARYTDDDLRRRYQWIMRRLPEMSREELEEIADRWQLARQEVSELPIACDVQQIDRDTCRGWDDFSNEELSRFLFEMSGKQVTVI